ncbi:pinopsin-like isoform X3 [Xiphophorus couchianus]|uniref:pinopsin-like isoform X3 n=1 Tax=Xiphophorus couchianus TaxID=32473 RepID=UPI0010170FCB|nr:pinopsin-like isoform X3 [Xiphophorus couchianus]
MMIHTQQNSNLSGGQQNPPGSDSSLSRAAHTSVAVALGFILVLGIFGNFLLLLVFSRYPGLRTPANLLLVNISISDMLVCLFGTPLSFAASVRGRWLTGSCGCRWYGFSNALFGVVSLVSLSLLSFERYAMTLSGSQLNSSHYRRARLSVAFSWLYSLAWTLPPLLGWSSSYGPEGPGTVCSVQWRRRSVTARSYIICLFVFCLLLPLLLMFFCYGRILLAVRGVMRQAAGINRSQAEGRILLMVVAMVTGYLLCWTPYAVMAMLASFGRPGAVPPAAALIPALLAKTSTVLNPVICVLLNNQFSRCFLDMISCSSEDSSADVSSSRSNWTQNMPTEEPNTDPALLPSTDHNVQLPVQV